MGLYEYEKRNIRRAAEYAPECALFLKRNEKLPLEKPCKVALFGSGARRTIKGGTGSGDVNSRFYITAEKGLESEGFTITSKLWLDEYDAIYEDAFNEFIANIKAEAKRKHTMAVWEGMGRIMPEPEYNLPHEYEGDVAIYVLSRISGEGSDRAIAKGEFLLSDTEVRDILSLNRHYGTFILVLNTGGPVDLTPVSEVQNILLLSQLGVSTGRTMARILLGKDVPSGKLTTTWSKWEDYCPDIDFGDKNDTYYNEGIYVGYRYFDTVGKRADYPFGFGLSYTSFEIKTEDACIDGQVVTLKVRVKNVGNYRGKEVVQVYVTAPGGTLDKPYKSLVAFGKTKMLNKGEDELLEISFNMENATSYDTAGAAYILEAGDYIVRIGNSSVDVSIAAVVNVDETIAVRRVKNLYGDPGFKDKVYERRLEKLNLEGIRRLELKASEWAVREINYEREYEIDEELRSFSVEQLAMLNTGAFSAGGALSIIGNAGKAVAGAAGETAKPINSFPNMVMADGPAGLRLSKRYVVDKDGMAHAIGSGLPADIERLLPKGATVLQTLMMKTPTKENTRYQYATAIPIGTAIAQSFNLELAKGLGDIVGDEMERFGVDLWLAPALNIHRSIRCGRNFEYFSEDPLVSGLMAGAITLGVQSHTGCGTTIKHYAANNQETNRYNNNSHISERAIREIYLKGFEICISMSNPYAVMTSYNLLNGEHTSESKDLIDKTLRCEWGYDNVVMTDWIINGGTMDKESIYRGPKAEYIAAAGGDLVMPGSKADMDAIVNAVNNGGLTKEQLLMNATRVYKACKKCN